MEHRRSRTVVAMDVIHALKRQGRQLYGYARSHPRVRWRNMPDDEIIHHEHGVVPCRWLWLKRSAPARQPLDGEGPSEKQVKAVELLGALSWLMLQGGSLRAYWLAFVAFLWFETCGRVILGCRLIVVRPVTPHRGLHRATL